MAVRNETQSYRKITAIKDQMKKIVTWFSTTSDVTSAEINAKLMTLKGLKSKFNELETDAISTLNDEEYHYYYEEAIVMFRELEDLEANLLRALDALEKNSSRKERELDTEFLNKFEAMRKRLESLEEWRSEVLRRDSRQERDDRINSLSEQIAILEERLEEYKKQKRKQIKYDLSKYSK